MPESLWQGWSRKGRVVAAMLLKISVDSVLPTTNHLESFNCLLKRKYIPRWQHSGARLRFDFLIHILISQILPEIYSLRRSQQHYMSWLAERFRASTSGGNLVDLARTSAPSPLAHAPRKPTMYWYEADTARDNAALTIVNLGRIDIKPSMNPDIVEATCAASSASLTDPQHTRYKLQMHREGRASCLCPDFVNRGGACKHLRALRLIVNLWARDGHVPPFRHPTSIAEALQVQQSPDPDTSALPLSAALLNSLVTLQQVVSHEGEPDECSEASIEEESDDAESTISETHSVAIHVCHPHSYRCVGRRSDGMHQDLISQGLEAVTTQIQG